MTGRTEFELIAELFRPLATDPAARALTDDGALLPAGADDLVLVKDAIVAGVHFLACDPPETVGQKALRVNLSDLAAMGATPAHYLLALIRPGDIDDAYLDSLVSGLAQDQAAFGVSLVGGDTVATSGPLVLSVTALGRVPPGAALTRSGASPGEDVWVSGALGDAALGLQVLRGAWHPSEEAAAALVRRYRVPEPRLTLGCALRGIATACQDVSDGLVQDLGHIARESSVAVTIDAGSLPYSLAAADAPGALEAALGGGDDYELVFTAGEGTRRQIEAAATRTGVPVTLIGSTSAGAGVTVVDSNGRPLDVAALGWTHGWHAAG